MTPEGLYAKYREIVFIVHDLNNLESKLQKCINKFQKKPLEEFRDIAFDESIDFATRIKTIIYDLLELPPPLTVSDDNSY